MNCARCGFRPVPLNLGGLGRPRICCTTCSPPSEPRAPMPPVTLTCSRCNEPSEHPHRRGPAPARCPPCTRAHVLNAKYAQQHAGIIPATKPCQQCGEQMPFARTAFVCSACARGNRLQRQRDYSRRQEVRERDRLRQRTEASRARFKAWRDERARPEKEARALARAAACEEAREAREAAMWLRLLETCLRRDDAKVRYVERNRRYRADPAVRLQIRAVKRRARKSAAERVARSFVIRKLRKRGLSIPASDIPPGLIEATRALVLLRRELDR